MPQSNRPSILVVDDDVDTCANLADILTELGYDVDTAHCGEEAVSMVEQKAYGVALLDFKLPGIDGVTLAERIRLLRNETVAVMATAYASAETSERAKLAGIGRLLSKPIDLNLLLGIIREAIRRPTLLVVDDDQELCTSLCDVFREQAFRVCLVQALEQVTTQLIQSHHDVVLIDLKLPDGDATDVFECIQERYPGAPTVVITAHRDGGEQQLTALTGAVSGTICYKPFDLAGLLNTVRNLSSHQDA